MKFLSAALSALFLAGASAKPVNRRLGKNKVLNKKKLMRHAVPVDKNHQPIARKLEEEFEITGAHSIQFDSCISLRTNDEDLFDDMYNYAYQGYVVAQKSYVIFNVCKTQYCGYDGEGMQYMVDLGTYMGALAEYLPNKKEAFCEACEEFEDYCNPEEEEAEEEEEEDEADEEEEDEDEEDGEDRKLAKASRKLTKNFVPPKKSRKLANYIDCDECSNQGCYEEEEENDGDDEDAIEDEDIVEWVQEMAECKETEYQWGDDIGLYVGFMCNEYNDGVEIAVFVDEDCSMYTNQKQFDNIMDEDDENIYQLSETIVTYPFKYDVDCAGEVEYDDPDEDNDNEDENDDEDDEANEVCQNLLDEDALDLETCGQDGDEDEEEEEDEEDDENAANYEWYEYDIDADNAEEPEYVCKFLQEYEGEYTSVYETDNSGTHYDYTVYDAEAEGNSSGNGSGVGKTIAIIAIVVAVAVAAVFAVKAIQKKKQDDKAEPLTKKGGAMA